jgi:protein subunit release factor B
VALHPDRTVSSDARTAAPRAGGDVLLAEAALPRRRARGRSSRAERSAIVAEVFPVSPEKERALRARMERLGVRPEDLEERFVRSGGRGGQNVNKVSTCVVLRHRPSGVVVKCQQERSQALNRFLARRELLDRLEARLRGVAAAAEAERERIRRQKRRRSRRAKEKMLAAKHARSERKAARRPPSLEE